MLFVCLFRYSIHMYTHCVSHFSRQFYRTCLAGVCHGQLFDVEKMAKVVSPFIFHVDHLSLFVRVKHSRKLHYRLAEISSMFISQRKNTKGKRAQGVFSVFALICLNGS